MKDLFGSSPVPGLAIKEELVTPDEEEELIGHIAAAGLTPFQFGAFEGRRLTRSFGSHYDFQSHRLVAAEPIPSWLHPLRARAAAFAEVTPDAFAHALLIRYDPGTGIGWHKDRPAFDRIVGVSLGADVELHFRRRREEGRFERFRFPLPRRSAYLLSGDIRQQWEHGIPSHPRLRYSVTFRTLARRDRGPPGRSADLVRPSRPG
jgi:DNA oxidative demethylase